MTATRNPGEGVDRPSGEASLSLAWYRLDGMTGPAVHALIAFRESVFVVEQGCAYQEADGLDVVAWHLTAHDGDALVGCLRVIPPVADEAPTIGRVATRSDRRGQRIARRLMIEALRECAEQWPHRGVTLSAQVAVRHFYESLQFVAEGAPYLEDNIPHIAMTRAADRLPG